MLIRGVEAALTHQNEDSILAHEKGRISQI
jgi:hypothetical protein